MKYNELNDAAKETACEDHRYINTEYGDWDKYYISTFQAELQSLGFEDSAIWWSGFSFKGDGACFDCYCNTEMLFLLYAQTAAERAKKAQTAAWIDSGDAALLRHFDWLCDIFGDYLSLKINHKGPGMYNHENTRYLSGEWSWGRLYDDFKILNMVLDSFLEWAEDFRKDRCRDIYRRLEAAHDFLIKDQAIGETLEDIGTEFNAYGEEL